MDVMRASTVSFAAAKLVALIVVSLPLSWLPGVVWASNGDGWREFLSGRPTQTLMTFASSLLSNDITQAEDQLDFLCFWLPAWMLTTIMGGLSPSIFVRWAARRPVKPRRAPYAQLVQQFAAKEAAKGAATEGVAAR